MIDLAVLIRLGVNKGRILVTRLPWKWFSVRLTPAGEPLHFAVVDALKIRATIEPYLGSV